MQISENLQSSSLQPSIPTFNESKICRSENENGNNQKNENGKMRKMKMETMKINGVFQIFIFLNATTKETEI